MEHVCKGVCLSPLNILYVGYMTRLHTTAAQSVGRVEHISPLLFTFRTVSSAPINNFLQYMCVCACVHLPPAQATA